MGTWKWGDRRLSNATNGARQEYTSQSYVVMVVVVAVVVVMVMVVTVVVMVVVMVVVVVMAMPMVVVAMAMVVMMMAVEHTSISQHFGERSLCSNRVCE